jgi:hypothetical protein
MKTVVTRRIVRNKRLGQAAYVWALPMIADSAGAHAHFTARRERGDSYSAAARNLTNRGLGMLHHCLHTRQHYDETKAFPTRHTTPPAARKPSARQTHQHRGKPDAAHPHQQQQAAVSDL